MKKIGFVGAAEATTLIGDVTLAPAAGLETVSGKSFDPVPQSEVEGSSAVGAGSRLPLAVHVIGTAGVDGYEGVAGVVGVVGVVVIFELEPHPVSTMPRKIKRKVSASNSKPQSKDKTARIYHPPIKMQADAGIRGAEGPNDWGAVRAGLQTMASRAGRCNRDSTLRGTGRHGMLV